MVAAAPSPPLPVGGIQPLATTTGHATEIAEGGLPGEVIAAALSAPPSPSVLRPMRAPQVNAGERSDSEAEDDCELIEGHSCPSALPAAVDDSRVELADSTAEPAIESIEKADDSANGPAEDTEATAGDAPVEGSGEPSQLPP